MSGVQWRTSVVVGSRWWPEVGAGLALLASWFPLRSTPLSHDVAWSLWLGRQIAHGAGLYSQLNEVNPPLWFWMNTGVSRLAEIGGASSFSVLIAAFLAAAALAIGLLGALLHAETPRRRAWIYAAFGLTALALTTREFGQREQYLLIASTPYVALAAQRARGLRVDTRLAFAIGLFAATGFALKPFFAAAPVLLEAWLLVSRRRDWRLLRGEVAALVLVALAYVAAVLFLAPAYLTAEAPMAALAYGAYNMPLGELFETELALPAALIFGGALLVRPRSPLSIAFLIAGMAFTASFFVQAKGWFYQAMPAVGFLTLAVAAEAPDLAWSKLDLRRKIGALCLVLGVAVPVALTAGLGFNTYHNRYRGDVLALTAGLPPGTPVMAVSSRSTFAWPMVEERGLLWTSRYSTFWMLPAVVRDRKAAHPSAEVERLSRQIHEETLEDLRCHPAVRIWIDDAGREARDRRMFGDPTFDYLAYLREDPGLAEVLDHYDVRQAGPWRVLDLRRPTGIARPRDCRTISWNARLRPPDV